MRVGMYYRNDDVRIEELPVPQIREDEFLLKVEASGICGSDLMEWYRAHKAPLVLGHEIAGVVHQVGEDVRSVKLGDRVAVAHHVPCMTCRYCLSGHQTVCEMLRTTNIDPGGFAEYVRIPAINVERGTYLLPDHVSFAEGTFVEPLACVLRGQKAARIRIGATVVVIGCGIAGLLHVKAAIFAGAGLVVASDPAENRRDKAKSSGAHHTFSPEQLTIENVTAANGGRKADVVIVCTGALTAVEQALELVDRGGTVLFFAPVAGDAVVPVQLNKIFWRNEITLTSSYAGDVSDHEDALALISTGAVIVSDLITDTLPLAEIQSGFHRTLAAEGSIKVIVEPQL